MAQPDATHAAAATESTQHAAAPGSTRKRKRTGGRVAGKVYARRRRRT